MAMCRAFYFNINTKADIMLHVSIVAKGVISLYKRRKCVIKEMTTVDSLHLSLSSTVGLNRVAMVV